MYRLCNRIYLWKGTTSKKCCYNSEKCKDFCQPFKFISHSILDIIHRSSGDFTFFIFYTEFYSQKCLCIFCCHSKKRRYPHPEHRSRSTDTKSCCHTYDTSGSDIGSQCCAKCCKRGYIACPFFFFKNTFQCPWKFTYLYSS